MANFKPQLIELCKRKLIQTRAELLNRVRGSRVHLAEQEVGGDEVDQSMRLLTENGVLAEQKRVLEQIVEIDAALARIQRGSFGLCEETDEPIETERLLAIPWTRLSIEGAEIREAMSKRFAR